MSAPDPQMPPQMPSMSEIYEMATRMAQGQGTPAKKAKTPKHFVGIGSTLVGIVASWIAVSAAHPLSHAAHSAGNFFVNDPGFAGAAVFAGLLWPRFLKMIKRG